MRVLALNVHNPSARDLGEIAEFLEHAAAEVIALSECRAEPAERIAEILDCAGFIHAHAPYWGNALMTRSLPLEETYGVDLPLSDWGEARSAAVATVVGPGWHCRFVATHLDVATEDDRLKQVRHLAASDGLDLLESVLLGDFNALTRTDYGNVRWAEIEAQRELAGIPPPAHELTTWLRDELALEDAYDARPDGIDFEPTCRFGTRVDYVLVGPRSSLRVRPGSYHVLGAMARGLTDHNAVTADLVPR